MATTQDSRSVSSCLVMSICGMSFLDGCAGSLPIRALVLRMQPSSCVLRAAGSRPMRLGRVCTNALPIWAGTSGTRRGFGNACSPCLNVATKIRYPTSWESCF